MSKTSTKSTASKKAFNGELDVFLVYFAVLIMAVFHYGIKGLLYPALTTVLAALCEAVIGLFDKKRGLTAKLHMDITEALSCGLCIGLMLSAKTPLWAVLPSMLIAYALSYFLPKLLYKSILKRQRLFSTAALTVALLSLLPSRLLFSFDEPGSLGAMLLARDSTQLSTLNLLNVLSGKLPSFLGTGCVIVLLIGLIFLTVRHPKRYILSIFALVGAAVTSLLLPRHGISPLRNLIFDLSAGMLLFCSVFIFSSEKISPKQPVLAALSGLVCGALTILTRRIGLIEETVCLIYCLLCLIFPIMNGFFRHKKPKLPATARADILPRKPRSDDDYMDDISK